MYSTGTIFGLVSVPATERLFVVCLFVASNERWTKESINQSGSVHTLIPFKQFSIQLIHALRLISILVDANFV